MTKRRALNDLPEATTPPAHRLLMLALHDHVLRVGIQHLEVSVEQLPDYVDAATRGAPDFSADACFARLLDELRDAQHPTEIFGSLLEWDDPDMFCCGKTRVYREGDGIVIELIERAVKPKPWLPKEGGKEGPA